MMAIAALRVAKKAYQERGVGGAVESGLGLSPGIISELREVQEKPWKEFDISQEEY